MSGENLPTYHSTEYWESSRWVRAHVDELHRKKKQEHIKAQLELAREDPLRFMSKYGCPYYGRL